MLRHQLYIIILFIIMFYVFYDTKRTEREPFMDVEIPFIKLPKDLINTAAENVDVLFKYFDNDTEFNICISQDKDHNNKIILKPNNKNILLKNNSSININPKKNNYSFRSEIDNEEIDLFVLYNNEKDIYDLKCDTLNIVGKYNMASDIKLNEFKFILSKNDKYFVAYISKYKHVYFLSKSDLMYINTYNLEEIDEKQYEKSKNKLLYIPMYNLYFSKKLDNIVEFTLEKM